MLNTPRPYEIYRHFKGNLYQILVIAKDSENGRPMVVYQGLYEPFQVYVRDLEMFMEPVDRSKYSKEQFPQENRFERISNVDILKCHGAQPGLVSGAEKSPVEEVRREAVIMPAVVEESFVMPGREESVNAPQEINPALVLFLDAEEYEDKLDVLRQIKNELTPEILTPMELSLGMEPQEGSVDQRYQGIKINLLTKQKYERQRL